MPSRTAAGRRADRRGNARFETRYAARRGSPGRCDHASEFIGHRSVKLRTTTSTARASRSASFVFGGGRWFTPKRRRSQPFHHNYCSLITPCALECRELLETLPGRGEASAEPGARKGGHYAHVGSLSKGPAYLRRARSRSTCRRRGDQRRSTRACVALWHARQSVYFVTHLPGPSPTKHTGTRLILIDGGDGISAARFCVHCRRRGARRGRSPRRSSGEGRWHWVSMTHVSCRRTMRDGRACVTVERA